jgi:hypothetical protein
MIPIVIPQPTRMTTMSHTLETLHLRETMFCVYAELYWILSGSLDVDGLDAVVARTRRVLERLRLHPIAVSPNDVATAAHLSRSVEGVLAVATASGRIGMLDGLSDLAQAVGALAAAVMARPSGNAA